MTEMLNYNFPHAWFKYVYEVTQRLKANKQPISMQIMLKKLILGVGFPMLEKPGKPVIEVKVGPDSTEEEVKQFEAATEKYEHE